MSYLERVAEMLAEIRAEQRYRELPARELSGVIDYSSNDYLGLASEPQVVEALKRATRVASGGARLLGGRHHEHWALEEELAQWLGRERVLLFSSGYHAALGAIPVLAETVETIASDECNHASLIDGIRLSPQRRSIYAHGAFARNDARSALVVSESVFSMEGDTIDPAGVLAQLRSDDVLLVDEAHALGVVGPEGAGLARGLDDPRVIVLATLSKALGAHGGFIAAPAPVIELLVNRARTFIFDTALPPAIVLAARIALLVARHSDDRRARLRANAARLREGLREIEGAPPHGPRGGIRGPIVPLIIGGEERALQVSEQLARRGIFVPAIRPPTVTPGSSRLRFSIRADHTPEQIDFTISELCRCIVTS